MTARETVRRCSTCDALTPHRRRVVTVPRAPGALAFGACGAALALGVAGPVLVAFLLLAGTSLVLRDRHLGLGLGCERCRTKRDVALRGKRPTLDGMTEINL